MREEVDGQRRAERRDPEQPQIDHRVRERQLPADEQHPDDQPDHDRDDRQRDRSRPGPICLSPKITASTATSDMAALRGRAGRRRDPGTPAGRAARGRAARPSPAREQEHRAPPEILEHDPAEDRADGAARRERRDPDGDRDRRWRGSLNMWKISDRVEGASVAPAIPEQRPGDDQHLGAGRERRQQRHAPNAAAPMSSSFRRPIRSPRVPIVIRKPATKNP